MKSNRFFLLTLAAIISLTTIAQGIQAQTGRLYQQMTQAERTAYVAEQARNIARRISGASYQFTPAFEAEIQKHVESYVKRIGNDGGDRLWKGDARFGFERGRDNAPVIIKAFKTHNVSPLIGLYIPLIESEYVNIEKPNSAGSIGMFQFLPKTGQRYGLTVEELLDVEKSADAAARYINDGLEKFKGDAMKEALAVLSYNRGRMKVESDLQLVADEQSKACSLCALTAARTRLDQTFQTESVHYVPRFFAAAIIGENPRDFGLELQPLSSYEAKN